ncbi:MAG: hypothetical protein IJL70_10010 [Treponema sp.]|jgi:hypothetical protein|nr:hypothetical protein [Treponema sp.]
MEKKEYKAPYFRARYMTAIEPLMVSQISDTDTGFEGGLNNDDDLDLDGQ